MRESQQMPPPRRANTRAFLCLKDTRANIKARRRKHDWSPIHSFLWGAIRREFVRTVKGEVGSRRSALIRRLGWENDSGATRRADVEKKGDQQLYGKWM